LKLGLGVGGVTRASPPNAATISRSNVLQTGKLSVNPTATVFKDGNIKYFTLLDSSSAVLETLARMPQTWP